MLNLVIDIGNTLIKVAIFNHGELMLNFSTNDFQVRHLDILKADHPNLEKVIVSTVRERDSELMDHLHELFNQVVELDHTTPLPLLNEYETPETLGKDRIAAAVGANWLFPEEDLLVIDAGTAITYEFISKKNQYLGGFITPGIRMRLKALHTFTRKLPLLEPDILHEFSGLNTFESILGGIRYGLEGETEGIINYFKSQHPKFKIILTGGDTNYFEKIVKNYNFVTLELTLIGLNRILEFIHPD